MKSAEQLTRLSSSFGALLLCACAPAAEDSAIHAPVVAAESTVVELTLSPEAIASNGIRLESAVKKHLRPTFRVPARIAFNPEGMAHVGSPVKGRIHEWTAKLGDEALQGSVLFTVESPELGEAQSEYLVRRGAAAAIAPQVDIARRSHERSRSLYEESRGIALGEVDKREAELVTAEAAWQAARAAEGAALNKLSLMGMTAAAIETLATSGRIDPRCAVRAPIAGQVIERRATLGELVGPERDALLVLADISRLSVSADVPEARLRDTVVGARARVLLGLEEEHWCEGTVAFISPALDVATRSVRVRIDVHDRHPELRPGVFARAEIEIPTLDGVTTADVIAVPEDAVRTMGTETLVFVPVPGHAGAFVKRSVRIGTSVSGWVPVHKGLSEGEQYVAQGAFVLEAEMSNTQVSHAH